MQLTHCRALCLMVLVALLWSTAGVVTRHLQVADGFEPMFWRSFSTLLTLLTLAVLLPATQGRAPLARMRAAGWALSLPGLCWSVVFTAFMLALTLTSVGNVRVSMAGGRLCTALVACFARGHRLAPRNWLAIVLAGAGIAWRDGAQLNVGERLGRAAC
ncbi:MAG TPA: EamA family transporter [Pseudorhodoferax sp.]|nr:EamA family transporter [Pseudorhodoferax sp.]